MYLFAEAITKGLKASGEIIVCSEDKDFVRFLCEKVEDINTYQSSLIIIFMVYCILSYHIIMG